MGRTLFIAEGLHWVEVRGPPRRVDATNDAQGQSRCHGLGKEPYADLHLHPSLDDREGVKEQAEEDAEPEERPEDFGIDPNSATYKYDTGRRR